MVRRQQSGADYRVAAVYLEDLNGDRLYQRRAADGPCRSDAITTGRAFSRVRERTARGGREQRRRRAACINSTATRMTPNCYKRFPRRDSGEARMKPWGRQTARWQTFIAPRKKPHREGGGQHSALCSAPCLSPVAASSFHRRGASLTAGSSKPPRLRHMM